MSRSDKPLSYWVSLARIGFEEDLFRLMEKHELNKSGLAGEFGASAPYITKALRGDSNFTLKTMAKLARAVGGILTIRLADQDSEVVRVVNFDEAAYLDDRAAHKENCAEGLTIDNVISFSDHVSRRSYVPAASVIQVESRSEAKNRG